MVGVAGFEPATPASRTQCSTGLSHTPTWNAAYSLGFRSPQGADLRKLITVDVRLKTQILPAGEAAVAAAARILAEGGLVAFPTETVYGLGADATNPAAIARLYQAKGRPAFNPLIAHVGDIAAARQIARFDAACDRAGRGILAGPADAGAAENARIARWPTSPPPASTRSRSGYRPTLWRATSCELSAARWWRHRRISPAMSRRPRPPMCRATLRAGST